MNDELNNYDDTEINNLFIDNTDFEDIEEMKNAFDKWEKDKIYDAEFELLLQAFDKNEMMNRDYGKDKRKFMERLHKIFMEYYILFYVN